MPEVPPVPDDHVEPKRELTVELDADARHDPWADTESETPIDSDFAPDSDFDPGTDPDPGAATDLAPRVAGALADGGSLARTMPSMVALAP